MVEQKDKKWIAITGYKKSGKDTLQKERNAVKTLLKHGVIKKGEITQSYASFVKNWK